MKKYILTTILISLIFTKLKGTNYAYDLTATGVNYLKTTNAPLTGVSAYTIECWFNNSGNTYVDNSRIFGFDNFECEIALVGNKIEFYDGGWRTTSSSAVNTGWHHISVTNDKTNVYVYLDGTQILTRASVAKDFTNDLFYIGIANTKNSNSRIRGYYDEVRIWKAARTLTQINTDRYRQLIGNETNLVAYYQMNNLNDKTSSNNTLISVGTTGTKYFKFGDYLYDFSIKIDEYDDKILLNGSNITGNGDFTTEFQFKTSAPTSASYRRLFCRDGFFLAISSNGTLSTYMNTWSNTWATNLNDGVWHHIAIVRVGSNVTTYLDGAKVNERNIGSVNFSGINYFGGLSNNAGFNESLDGELDEIKIWNVAKTQSQIYDMMDSVLVGNESNLLSYFDMNTPSNTVINVKSGGTEMTRYGTAGSSNLPQFNPIFSYKQFEPGIKSTTEANKCGPGSLNLSATATKGTIRWYTTVSGGASIASGNNFTTPNLNSTFTYYVDAIHNSTPNGFRTPVVATINPLPTVTGLANNNPLCEGNSTTLDGFGANTYIWTPNNNITISGNNVIAKPTTTTLYTVTGTLTATGCSNTGTVNLIVTPAPNLNVTKNGTTLTATESGATYQWLNCSNNSEIANATQQSYSPTSNGNYSVIVTKNNCSDTSICTNVIINSSNQSQLAFASSFSIYPNPSIDYIQISNNKNQEFYYTIFDIQGKKILNGRSNSNESTINLSALINGVYSIKISNQIGEQFQSKIIKN